MVHLYIWNLYLSVSIRRYFGNPISPIWLKVNKNDSLFCSFVRHNGIFSRQEDMTFVNTVSLNKNKLKTKLNQTPAPTKLSRISRCVCNKIFWLFQAHLSECRISGPLNVRASDCVHQVELLVNIKNYARVQNIRAI